ncbi:MAG: tetratricopeptide repeat protein [Pirellulaceae bacterium]
MSVSTTARSIRRRRFAIYLALGIALGVASGVYVWRNDQRIPPLPPSVTEADYERASREFAQEYGRPANQVDTWSWLAESYSAKEEWELAAACFDRIPSDHPKYGIAARIQQAHALWRLNRAIDCEAQLNEVLNRARTDASVDPGRTLQALDLKRYLLSVELRSEALHDVLRIMQALDVLGPEELTTLYFPSLLRWHGPQAAEALEAFWEADQDSFPLRVALARYRIGQGKLTEARELLAGCLEEQPNSLIAAAAMLECLRELGDDGAAIPILERLPELSPNEPWLLMRMRGHFANDHAQSERAVEAFSMVLAADPASAEAHQGLATAYRALGRDEALQRTLARGQVLARIQNRLGWVQGAESPAEGLLEVAELCVQIELDSHARGIVDYLQRNEPTFSIPDSLVAALASDSKSSGNMAHTPAQDAR